jgi:hypothetical protein
MPILFEITTIYTETRHCKTPPTAANKPQPDKFFLEMSDLSIPTYSNTDRYLAIWMLDK